jgi:hypothetical protein
MVSVMVEQFRNMQMMLADTIEQYETVEFRALDGRIASVFDAIYQHDPQNAEEARTMVGFFLDIIESNDAGDNLHLIKRVRTIVDDYASRCKMEIAHGAGI